MAAVMRVRFIVVGGDDEALLKMERIGAEGACRCNEKEDGWARGCGGNEDAEVFTVHVLLCRDCSASVLQ